MLILILSKASRTILSMPSPHCSFATRARSTRIAARIALSQSCETARKQTEHPVGSTTGQGVTGAARSSKIVRKAGTEKRAGSRVRGDPSNKSGGNGAGNKRYVIGCCICNRVDMSHVFRRSSGRLTDNILDIKTPRTGKKSVWKVKRKGRLNR